MFRIAVAMLLSLCVAAVAWADPATELKERAATVLTEAEAGNAYAQLELGDLYFSGEGVPEDDTEAVKWYRKAAEQGLAKAQTMLGMMYYWGKGLSQDYAKAAKWYRKAAEQDYSDAQFNLGVMYEKGKGVLRLHDEAVKWYRRAAEQGDVRAQHNLGMMYKMGDGVPQDYVMAYMWLNIASAKSEHSIKSRDEVAARMTPAQLAAAQQVSREWQPRPPNVPVSSSPSPPQREATKRSMESTGTGFVVSKAGHVLTNHHVIDGCQEVRTRVPAGNIVVTPIVARDPKNDLALVKLPSPSTNAATFRDGKTVRQGDGVVAIGFPLRGLLASGANLTTGAVSALAGIGDDARFMQITAPVQSGSSGGPLLDLSGNVVGVVVGKLDAMKVAKAIGEIPQNVNFAITVAVVRGFLDANGVKYESALSNKKLEAADVGELAKKFIVVVECWK